MHFSHKYDKYIYKKNLRLNVVSVATPPNHPSLKNTTPRKSVNKVEHPSPHLTPTFPNIKFRQENIKNSESTAFYNSRINYMRRYIINSFPHLNNIRMTHLL